MEQSKNIEEEDQAWDMNEIADKSFNEVLAKAITDQKIQNVGAVLAQFRKGEAGAIKMVAQALSEHRHNEENSFPVSDDRFKQIIQMAADAIGTGEI